MKGQQFEQAVHEHYATVYRFALGLAKNEAEACDLTQQTFYLLASKGAQLRDASKLRSWLMTTCYREFLRGERHRRHFPHFEVSLVEHELPEVTAEMADQIDAESVMQALQEVDDMYRVPLLLFYLRQHSYKEIAELLGVPIGTVMSRLARGKDQLRQLMSKRLPRDSSKLILCANTARPITHKSA